MRKSFESTAGVKTNSQSNNVHVFTKILCTINFFILNFKILFNGLLSSDLNLTNSMKTTYFYSSLLALVLFQLSSCKEKPKTTQEPNHHMDVIAYYGGDPSLIDNYNISQLDQIIYSFVHLHGNRMDIDDAHDSVTIAHLVSLKNKFPDLKILLSLGGWCGCRTCSDVFSTAEGRDEFAQSVKDLMQRFDTDGIDLDWEYPAIEGCPDHPYMPEDKENFTMLVKELRKTLGDQYQISFAAGGFEKFLKESIEWEKVMPIVDRVNLMSYDLVNGNSPVTGHHTPLYSTPSEIESIDNAIQFFDSLHIPRKKIIIGAAFYGRVWENVQNIQEGLYQAGKFKQSVGYNKFEEYFYRHPGFKDFWDSVAQAPYSYNKEQQLFATYDDSLSIALKTEYVIDKGLGGIMFWQLANDLPLHGLLNVIDEVKKKYKP